MWCAEMPFPALMVSRNLRAEKTHNAATRRCIDEPFEPVQFRSVAFANENVGWAGSLTEDYVLYETRDGGQTWQDITNRIMGADIPGICGLWVASENIIYGVGRYSSPARLIKSTDGGQTWFARDMSSQAEVLVDVFFFDEQNPHHRIVRRG